MYEDFYTPGLLSYLNVNPANPGETANLFEDQVDPGRMKEQLTKNYIKACFAFITLILSPTRIRPSPPHKTFCPK